MESTSINWKGKGIRKKSDKYSKIANPQQKDTAGITQSTSNPIVDAKSAFNALRISIFLFSCNMIE